MDWSKFFSEYFPYVSKTNQKDTTSITRPIYDDDLALGTYQFTSDKINTNLPASLWDSLGWGSSDNTTSSVSYDDNKTSTTTDDASKDFTIEQYIHLNNLHIGEASQNAANIFAKTVAPIIKTELINLNSNKNLGLTAEQIEEATKRITFLNAIESSYGTSNVANTNNNLGGVKYTSWLLNFDGTQGLKANDGGYYTKYPGIRAFYRMLIGELYGNKYKEALYAKSDNDFILILKKNGYFTADANEYYKMVFNSLNTNAWYKYKNPEMT